MKLKSSESSLSSIAGLSRRVRRGLAATAMAGALLLASAVGYRVARATGVPTTKPLSYSGTIDEGGQLVDGTRDFTLRLWSDPASTDGTFLKCTTIAPSVAVSMGRFRIPLDDTCTQPIHDNADLYLEVLVGNGSLGRRKVGAVPYAIEADHASAATGALQTQLAGLSTKLAPLTVQGNAVTFAGSVAFGGRTIARITQCTSTAAPVGCPGCNHPWAGSDCDNGLPLGTCFTAGGRVDQCGGSITWSALLPGELGTNGGMSWYSATPCAGTTIRSVYFCDR